MPLFMSLQPHFSRENLLANVFIIDSTESMDQFFVNINQNKAVYERIYLDIKMIAAMKARAKDLPQAYQEEFNAEYPGGMVGFTTMLATAVDTAPRADIQGPEANSDLSEDDMLDMLAPVVAGQESILEADIDELDDITKPARSFTRALDATRNEDTPESPKRAFTSLPLIDQSLYHQIFDEGSFERLAQLIAMKDSQVTDLPGQGKTHRFKQHLDNILPIVEFAMTGARHEWQDNKTGDQEASMQKMETFEAIYNLLRSMRALASNKSCYTVEHYQNKLETILASPVLDDSAKQALGSVLDQVVQEHVMVREPSNFYQHKKGSTAFDASLPNQEIKGNKKRLTIEHTSQPNPQVVVVTGKFNYSRKDVLEVQTGKFSGIKKLFSQPKSQLAEMNAQVRDFVAVALNDYHKGTRENPIYLQPSKGNQSELSLAILLEFKQRAIIEGRELIAADDTGKRIKITPTAEFTKEEKQYFAHFAMQVPKVKGKGMNIIASENTAGYQLLKETKMDDGKALKDHKVKSLSEGDMIDTLTKAMSNQLNDRVANNAKRHEEQMADAVKPLRELSKPTSSTRASI